MSIAPFVKKVLASSGQPLTAGRIASELVAQGFKKVTTTEVNSYLYMAQNNGTVCKVEIEGLKAPGWKLSESSRQQMGLSPRPTPEPKSQDTTPALSLYRWQQEALGVWERHRHRGMVEAVTGSGKTRLAFAAWDRLRQKVKPLNALVVVPTIPLMNQWYDSFQALFPDRRIGRIGDKYRDDFSRATICVAVINSAVIRVERLLQHCRSGPTKSLLIADECHRYIDAPVFSEIRRFPFDHVMALSATIDPFEVRGYGKIIYSYTFADAVRDELVPRFDLMNVAVPLTKGEQEDYDELTEKIGDQIQQVKLMFEDQLRGVPDTWFFRKLKQLLLRPDGTEEPSIKYLFGLLFRRTKIVYTAQYKMRLAKEISQLLLNQGRKKMIAFFERIQSAEDVQEDLAVETAERLKQELAAICPMWCRVLHSGLPQDERRSVLDEFRRNGVSALLTCRVLDEGLDVPQIDAALLVASTQSRRQRIQRIGRALRKGNGGKRPLVITLHVPGTTDGNVTADDRELFGEAADIHRVTDRDCLATLRTLLTDASKVSGQ
jgi:RNA polymerase primary sigma factor